MKYTGSCHCGDVAFEAEGEIKDLLECNCSICSRKGSLLWFAFANDPHGNAMAAINARALESIDLSKYPRTQFNGKAL